MRFKYIYSVFVVIAVILILYVIFNHYRLFGGNDMSIYEVTIGDVNKTYKHRGILLKEQEQIKCGASGYIEYYANDLERVYRGQLIYVIKSNNDVADANNILEYGYSKYAGIITYNIKTKVFENATIYEILKNQEIVVNFNSDYDYDNENGKRLTINFINEGITLKSKVSSFMDMDKKMYRFKVIDYPEKFMKIDDAEIDICVKITTGLKIPLKSIVSRIDTENGITKTILGVYDMNKGYAVFRQIEIVDKDDEYAIIRDDTIGGIKLYDHIALNAINIEDGDLICYN